MRQDKLAFFVRLSTIVQRSIVPHSYGKSPIVNRMHIYLDHNSTTPIAPEVAQVIADCYRDGYVNPASQHRPGQKARARLEQIRQRMTALLGGITQGMATDTLVLTSGGTESNNLAIRGLAMTEPKIAAAEQGASNRPVVLISAIEHPSVMGAAAALKSGGIDVCQIPVDQDCVIQVVEFEKQLSRHADIRLVCVMLANNETGVIQPVSEIAAICRERSIPVHCDAVQGVAKIGVNFRELGVDTMTFSAHKFHGPRGIGGLLVRRGVTVNPILFGGFQQMAVRPGTEDVALAAGMNCALELFEERGGETAARMKELRDQLQQTIAGTIESAVVLGASADRVPHTLNISFPNINRQAFLLAADLAGLAVSTGSACASGSSEPSHVISAMTSDKQVIEGSVRISLGAGTTTEETVESGRRIVRIHNDLQRMKSLHY